MLHLKIKDRLQCFLSLCFPFLFIALELYCIARARKARNRCYCTKHTTTYRPTLHFYLSRHFTFTPFFFSLPLPLTFVLAPPPRGSHDARAVEHILPLFKVSFFFFSAISFFLLCTCSSPPDHHLNNVYLLRGYHNGYRKERQRNLSPHHGV